MKYNTKKEKKIVYNINVDKITYQGIKVARNEGINIQTVIRNLLNDYLVEHSFIQSLPAEELAK